MKRILLLTVALSALLLMIFPAAATATPTLKYYVDRADFEAACTNLQLEDFEEATIPDNTVDDIDRPLDSTTSNAYFSPGDIEAGLSITTTGPDQAIGELAVYGAGYAGATSKGVAANFFVDTLAVDFTSGDVTCVGIDLASYYSDDPNLQINIYGTSGPLGSTTAPGTDSGVFWGVCSSEVITRITIYSATNQAEGVDNIAFGTCKMPPGWSKGKKTGWDGSTPPGLDKKDKTPSGFEQGNKNGWSLTE